MKIMIGAISGRSVGSPRSASLHKAASEYLERCRVYAEIDSVNFRSEEALFEHVEKQRSRVPLLVALLDSLGKSLSSEQFAAWLGGRQDAGQQSMLFAIGPADGWSEAARNRAGLLLSLGPFTLPHELVRVVLAEQIYRAFTILTGHPYHCGH